MLLIHTQWKFGLMKIMLFILKVQWMPSFLPPLVKNQRGGGELEGSSDDATRTSGLGWGVPAYRSTGLEESDCQQGVPWGLNWTSLHTFKTIEKSVGNQL